MKQRKDSKLLKKSMLVTTSAFMATTILPVSPVKAVSEPSYPSALETRAVIRSENLALNKTATASYSYNQTNFAPARAVDGDLATRWATEPKGENQWLCVDLGSETTMNEFGIFSETNDAQKIEKFTIEGSNDNETFETIYDAEASAAGYDFDTVVTLDHEVSYRYVRITINSLINGAYPSISLREFEIYHVQEEVEGVDKTELQKAYEECKGYVPEYSPADGNDYSVSGRYRLAVAAAETVLANADATEDEVKKATEELYNRYWAIRVEDNQYHYSPTRTNYDYSGYTYDSIKPLLKAYYMAKINNYVTTPEQTELYKQMCADFEEGAKNVVPYGDLTGIMVGFDGENYRSDLRGTWTITQEVNEENRIITNVKYVNDGINPVTDEDEGKFSSSNMRSMRFYVDIFSDGKESMAGIPITLTGIDGSTSNGYEGSFDVQQLLDDAGYSMGLTAGFIQMRASLSGKFYRTPGFYRLRAPRADTTKLQELYDGCKDYLPEYLPHDWHIADFNDALKKTVAVLENEEVTKAEVEETYTLLEARYYSLKVQDAIAKFDPATKNYDYRPYTTESILPLVKHEMLANDLWFGGKTEEYVAKYKEACTQFEVLEAQLVAHENKKGLTIGFNPNGVRNSTKQGHFTVTERVLATEEGDKIQLHIEFINDGIHPVSGKEKTQFTTADMNKGTVRVSSYDYDGNSGNSFQIRAKDLLPLDGETDKTAGFQTDLVVEPGEYEFKFSSNYNDNWYEGYYRTNEEVRTYTVKVNDEVVKVGEYNEKVTVTAPAAQEGMVFAGWSVNGAIVSTDEVYNFFISSDVTLVPVYVEEGKTVETEAQCILTNTLLTRREDTKADVKFVSQLVVPEGYTIKEAGLIWTSKDVELIIDGALNPELKPTYITKISNTDQFSVTIKGMPSGKSMKGRIFATLVDEDGNEVFVYSEEGFAKN